MTNEVLDELRRLNANVEELVELFKQLLVK